MSEYADKLRSLSFARPSARGVKVTTDVHDHHTVDVIEHWDDRVDVTVRPETIHLSRGAEHGE